MHELTPKQRAALDALLTSKTFTEAANKAGISRRTLARYVDTPEFKAAMRAEQARALGGANTALMQATREAVGVLYGVISNPEEQTSNRVNAARIVLEKALTYTEIVDHEERLAALEASHDKGH